MGRAVLHPARCERRSRCGELLRNAAAQRSWDRDRPAHHAVCTSTLGPRMERPSTEPTGSVRHCAPREPSARDGTESDAGHERPPATTAEGKASSSAAAACVTAEKGSASRRKAGRSPSPGESCDQTGMRSGVSTKGVSVVSDGKQPASIETAESVSTSSLPPIAPAPTTPSSCPGPRTLATWADACCSDEACARGMTSITTSGFGASSGQASDSSAASTGSIQEPRTGARAREDRHGRPFAAIIGAVARRWRPDP